MILRSTVGITSFLSSLFSFFLLFFVTLERCLGFRSFVLASDNFCAYFEPIKLSKFVLLSLTFSGSFNCKAPLTFYNWKMLHFFWTYAVFSLIVFSVKVTQPLKQKHSACSLGTRSFFRKPFFRKFVLVPLQEVLGDERQNKWYAPTSKVRSG